MRTLVAALVLALLPVGTDIAKAVDARQVQARYEGEAVFEWIEDPFIPKLRLTSELRFKQSDGRIWITPVDAIVDGRSVPKLFLELVGPVLESDFRKTAITYDYAVKSQHHPWKASQRMFYEGVMLEGVPQVEARVMYMLLSATGSRWAVQGPSNCFSRCHGPGARLEWRPRVDDEKVVSLVDWVRQENPDLEEIERRVRTAIIEEGPHSTVPIR